MQTSPIECATLDTLTLEPAPIRPEWVIAGRPVARTSNLTVSSDGTGTSFVWDCTAGTFHWYFGGDEIVYILEGEVHVENDAMQRRLAPGDFALFRADTWARWHVPTYVRKVAVCQDSLPAPLNFFMRQQRRYHRLRERLFGKQVRLPPAGPQTAPGRVQPA